jgi:hypothetical protein
MWAVIRRTYRWAKRRQGTIEGFWAPLSSIAANIVVVATLILALATYYQAQGQGQAEASLGYINRFNEGSILEARNLIYRSWLPYDFSGTNAALDQEVIDALLERVVPDVSTPEGLDHRLAIAGIVAFFDSAQTCVEQKACDGDVLRSQLGEYGRDFYCLYQSLIDRERQRGRLISFGGGLEQFTDAMGGCGPARTS